MPDLDDFAGAEAEPFVLPVERGKIREFALATGSRDPRFLDEPVPAIPPTFLMTAVYWQRSRHFAMGRRGASHWQGSGRGARLGLTARVRFSA